MPVPGTYCDRLDIPADVYNFYQQCHQAPWRRRLDNRGETMTLGRTLLAILIASAALLASACGGTGNSQSAGAASDGSCTPSDSPVITLAAYSNPYVAYGKLTSAFAAEWKESNDVSVIFQMSFGGSTTQAENVVGGLGADVYASSLGPDVGIVEDAGLITHDWEAEEDGSVVQSGAVVFAVRPGNP